VTALGDAPSAHDFVVGASARMLGLIDEARTIARTREPILLLGETGTGKERLARAIHALSNRATRPWVVANCASLTPELADSELFGHARGAFTGAVAARPGLLRKAHGGTIFLDEIGDIPIATQVKLLRVFEDRRIRSQGADEETAVDVRIIAATSVDIARAIREGKFRRDLWERFHTPLYIPPLRDRPEDVELLAVHFLKLHAGGEGLNPAATRISDAAIARLGSARWNGNARELEKAVKGALARTFLARSEVLEVSDFQIPADEPEMVPAEGAAESVRALARFVLGELEAGRAPPATIDAIAQSYPQLSLKRQLAHLFLSRYRGAEAHEKARRLFGYTSAESVRRLLRSSLETHGPSGTMNRVAPT
jgi:transcriptional regulator with GAF, ATPase, and Fis domain